MRSRFRSGNSHVIPASLVPVVFALVCWIATTVSPLTARAADPIYDVKFGSIAPAGTAFTAPLEEFKTDLEKKSSGRIRMKLYLGSVGDEKDIIRKMNLGQLTAAGVTGIGLAQVLPEIHVLDLPMIFETYDEVDYVYPRVLEHFQKAFEAKGFVFLGFTEAGFAYLFSKKRIETLDDLRNKARVWQWEGDPLISSMMDIAGIHAVSVPFTDIVMSLQTGMLDTIYAPPYAAIALQWFLHVKYMSEMPLAHGTGGVIVAKKKWDELPEDLKEMIRADCQTLASKLVATMRKDNEAARKELIEKKGIQVLPRPSPEEWNKNIDLAKRTQEGLVGKLYSREVLDMVLKFRDEARAKEGQDRPTVPVPK